VFFGRFIDQTFHVVKRLKARAPWKFIDAIPLGRRALPLRTTVPERHEIHFEDYKSQIKYRLSQWLSKFLSYSPLQTQTLSIPPQQKSQKRWLQKFHSTYCEKKTDNYEPHRLFYNNGHGR